METRDIEIQEHERIVTEVINRHNANIYTDISTLFDMGFETLGRVELLNTGLKLVDVSNKMVINYRLIEEEEDPYTFKIDVGSDILFPTAAADSNKATILQSHNVIVNHIVHRNRIFTDLTDQGRIVRAGVGINKSSHNYVFLSRPDRVYESNILDVITGNRPYMIKFVGEDITEGQVIIEVTSAGETHDFNTIEFTPFPISGMMELEQVLIENRPIENKAGQIEYTETNKFARTGVSYIPFMPIRGNRVNISVRSDTRIESMNGCTVGLGLVEAFETTYSDVSHFGYRFAPSEDSKLRYVDIRGTWSCPYREGVLVRVYDSEEEFNQMSDNYVVAIDDVVKGTVNLQKDRVYYLLFTMELQDNYPQCIESVKVTLE